MIEEYITISLTLKPSQITGVYALLGGTAIAAATVVEAKRSTAPLVAVEPERVDEPETQVVEEAPIVSPSDSIEIDADGHPWSALLHASTKAQTGAGLWRMKPGASRPAPLPGFPMPEGTGMSKSGTASKATEAVAEQTVIQAIEEDDEFAAFTAAAKGADAVDEAAAAKVSARSWSDADLSKLANQAATKLGDPVPVRELVTQFVPAGEPVHSRNIPADQREAFAIALEKKAGIEYAA